MRVALGRVSVLVMDGVPHASVGVGSSRVGIGACVGVASNLPGGKGMMVGGGRVGVNPKNAGVTSVGVGGRGTRLERTRMLTVPAQYITSEAMTAMARQP